MPTAIGHQTTPSVKSEPHHHRQQNASSRLLSMTLWLSAEPAWLIDGLLPARGLACIVGPPKSGKSFLATDMLCSVARGALYAGRETQQGAVIYLTGEGVSGFKRRLVAMRRHLEIEGRATPFYMIENVPDLGSERTELPDLIRDLDQFVAEKRA